MAESAVVGYPHDIKGEGIYAYVILKQNAVDDSNIIADLKMIVRHKIAAYAIPDVIQVTISLLSSFLLQLKLIFYFKFFFFFLQFCAGLPKTRSGKIMRRILRKVAANRSDELGDISTLADTSVVAVLVANHNKLMNKD